MSATGIDPRQVLTEVEASNSFLIQQIFKPIANEYRISVPTPGSTEEGRPLLFVKQKKMKIKEDIRFRLDPDRDEHLFMIKSKSVFEFRGRHEVLDAEGHVIGLLEKNFTKSLLRSHWHVRDASGTELFEEVLDGCTYVSLGFPLNSADGRILGMAGISTDVTARHRAEERFRRAFEAAPIGMALMSLEGRSCASNPRCARSPATRPTS